MLSSQEISQQRARKLKEEIRDYLEVKDAIYIGSAFTSRIQRQKEKILGLLGGADANWHNWQWQLDNRISNSDMLSKIISMSKEEIEAVEKVGRQFRWSISPYYLSLIDPENEACPIRLQAVPRIQEMEGTGEADPMAEEFSSPVKGITRRYPDRLIINVTNHCPMYCRHCQRRRNIGGADHSATREVLEGCIQYIKDNPEIRDVLITGGDAFCLQDEKLFWILSEIRQIPSVEIIRIGTRALVTLPQRITREFCQKLKSFKPLYINTQFNSPLEITPESVQACANLADEGIVLGNQMVLLKGINDDPFLIRKMNQELLKIQVRPYYIFHPKHVIGTGHFYVKIKDGLAIMESLRGRTSGLAIPTYIVNAPGGKGKIPLLPSYLAAMEEDEIQLLTWEGEKITYVEH